MNKKLQVFVSSTYTDLKEERQAAVEAILDAGHIPAGMELFKAGNESQLKTIYKWIDESDVYMLILGGRYGSVEAKSGKSYTQLEYEYALSKNIPVFAVVLSDSFTTQKITLLGLKNIIEQDSPEKYKTFKSLVMSKIIREVDDCKDIKIAVHSTLNEFINDYDLVGWVRNNNVLLEENNSLKLRIQKLQEQISNIEIDNETFPSLLKTLKMSVFDYYDNTKINALYFFLLNYDNIMLKHWYPQDDLACSIFFFLEKHKILIKEKETGPQHFTTLPIIRFNLTRFGKSFYKYILEEHHRILEYCNQRYEIYYGNKVFY